MCHTICQTKMEIKKKNEVYLKIDCEPSEARQISSYFTFEVPGAKFMPAVRNRIWDGKIRLFNVMTGELYIGLLSYLAEYLQQQEINYSLSQELLNDAVSISTKDVESFTKYLKLKSAGKNVKPRDYQIDALAHAIRNNRTLLISPTASGKSLIIYCLVRFYLNILEETEQQNILIIVPTTSLVEQLATDFVDYGWQESNIQKIYSGHDRNVTHPVVISTWQSIYKFPTKYFETFGAVIGDECHLFKAKSLSNIMHKLHLTKYRFGLTGTLDGTQTHRLVLEGLFGPIKKVVSTKELMEKKTLATLNIQALVLTYNDEECKLVKKMSYPQEMDFITSHSKRNKFICDLALRLKNNTLLLFQYVEKHGGILYDQIRSSTERPVYYVYGATDTEVREDIRKLSEEKNDCIIVASYGTFSTGINIKNLHNIIFASPSKSRIRTLQSIGRGLRTNENKSYATLYDIADDLSSSNKKNYTLNHFQERINIYNTEHFNYEIHRIRIS